MALSGRRFRRRKKEDIFVEGYKIDQANDVSPGTDRNDEQFHIFGQDNVDTDVQHNVGTLSIGLLDKYTSNQVVDLVTGQDPQSTAVKQYRVEDLVGVHVWANVKDERNTKYVKSWIIEGWTPGFPTPSGDPNSKAAMVLSGNGSLPRMFEGAWIKSKKVASGGSATITDTPIQVPNTSVYAVAVTAIRDLGGAFLEQQAMEVSAAMVTSTGDVAFSEIHSQLTLASVTHAWVLYLQSGAGVHPNVGMKGLRQAP